MLNSYTCIKELGIEPVLTTDHGVSIAFYYKGPDGNTIELFVDNFGNWDRSREYLQSSPDFDRHTHLTFSIGTFVSNIALPFNPSLVTKVSDVHLSTAVIDLLT